MEKFYLLDGSGYIFRAYYALQPLTDADGHNINAIFGFYKMLMNLLEQKPDYFMIARDAKEQTKRKEQFADYKANRTKMPDDLKPQLIRIHELADELGLPTSKVPGYEADDIIYSYVTDARAAQMHTTVVTSDKDLKQFIDESTVCYDSGKRITTDYKSFVAERQFEPQNIVDYLALVGDASDNIPGVMGIGDKGARTLIEKYATIENIYAHIDDISGKTHDKLLASKENAYMSKELITLMDIPPETKSLSWEDMSTSLNFDKRREIFVGQYGFQSFDRRLSELKTLYTQPQQSSLF